MILTSSGIYRFLQESFKPIRISIETLKIK